jgi:hypothetical protein
MADPGHLTNDISKETFSGPILSTASTDATASDERQLAGESALGLAAKTCHYNMSCSLRVVARHCRCRGGAAGRLQARELPIRNSQLELPQGSFRRDLTDAIKSVVEEAPTECYVCAHVFGKND